MRVFILAGGRGTRSTNPDMPKILTEVNGKTLLELQLTELFSIEEVTHVTFLLGFKAEAVVSALNKFIENNPSPIMVDYHVEPEPMGSAGMLRELILEQVDGICFVALGDILPRGGLRESFHAWRSSGRLEVNTIFVHPNNHPHDSDAVRRSPRSGLIHEILSKHTPRSAQTINLSPVGFFFLRSSDVQFWPNRKKLDLVTDVLPALLASEKAVYAKDLLRRSIDVGTPERLKRVQEDLLMVEMNIDWAVFIDRDDTIIRDPMLPQNIGKGIEFMPGVIAFLSFLNRIGIPVICISNQPSISKGQSTFREVDSQNEEIQSLLSSHHVYVDKWLYCPHHPESGFDFEIKKLKVRCTCRKPEGGMIEEVKLHHNIDVSRSVMIGDSFRDIEIKANLSLRVHYLSHGKCDILKNHICVENFEKAKDKIMNFLEGSKVNDYC